MKKIIQIMFLTAVSISFFACSGGDKDPLDLFFQSDLAASKNKTAVFTINFENLNPDQKSEFSSKVFVQKISDNEEGGLSFRIEESGNNIITFNGKEFIVLDKANKQISSSSKPETASQMASNLSQSFYMIIDNKLDTAEIRNSSKNLKFHGTVEVNGEDCYEVSQTAEGHADYNVENHYFFSTDDKLMKKYTSKITGKDKKVVQSIQFTISDLKLNEEIPADIFTQKIDTVNYNYTNLDAAHDMAGHGEGMENPDAMEGHGDMKGHGDMNGHEGMDQQPTGLLQNGAVAPDWTLLDSKGNKVTLSQLKGKVVVLDFWATWCAPCKQVMPTIQKLLDRYKSKGVMVYGVNTWERADAAKFMKDNKYSYGLLLKGDEVALKYKVEGIPTLYVINKAGKIVFSESGATPDFESKLESAIKSAL